MRRPLRVSWVPGSDLLHGRCHCGAETTGDEPGALWDWLLGHPDHPADGPAGARPEDARA
ncbi:hypothetical protein [Cryptosporangium sp. NPDC051539]|uniref:hypothetical protein n=1 Tax=Cryptosporangium sp. NPDC051539 TaxID=3363962 RepID=UPI0037B66D33